MVRRWLVGALAAVAASTVLSAPSARAVTAPQAPVLSAPVLSGPGESDPAQRAVLARKKPTKACRSRLINPRVPIAGKRFAKCTITAMRIGRTAHLENRYDDGSWSRGPMRYGKVLDTSAVYHDGSRLIVIDGAVWYKPVGKGWVRPALGGTDDQQIAWNIAQLWRGVSSPLVWKRLLATSKRWTFTGKNRRINGVRAREYAGTPSFGPGVTVSKYRVWLDNQDRPIRVASTLTVTAGDLSVTSTGRQDYSKWTKKVSIVPPRGR